MKRAGFTPPPGAVGSKGEYIALASFFSVRLAGALAGGFLAVMRPACAAPAETNNTLPQEPAECADDACSVTYAAAFFDRYRPVTALDMVARVPGFQIDDGEETRGFAGAAGNVLIDGERPSAKSDTVSDILERIPADNVERVDLIRGRLAGYDLRGQSVVVNVITRKARAGATAWEAGAELLLRSGVAAPYGAVSYTGSWRGVDIAFGVSAERAPDNVRGVEFVYDRAGLIRETRREDAVEGGFESAFNIGAKYETGKNRFQFNAQALVENSDETEISNRTRFSAPPVAFDVIERKEEKLRGIEVGGDWTRAVSDALDVKAIALYRRDRIPLLETLVDPESDNPALVEISVSDASSTQTETILRTQINYDGVEGHVFSLAAEGAINTLGNRLSLFVDSGAGPVEEIVPGANVNVKERRAEISAIDSWSSGNVVIEGGAAAEFSRISQTGDAIEAREFFFLKPTISVAYAPSKQDQYRVRLYREAAQLDFFDFVSAADFENQDFALGNPDLRPETRWIAEASAERRFGDVGALSVTIFKYWISDVQDQLPIGDGDEVPGNIGDGGRWGVRSEGAFPLRAIGLRNARLDFETQWMRSSATDPVTGRRRALSDQQSWFASIEFRQDFEAARWAWGWDIDIGGPIPVFGLDELEYARETPDLDVFFEITRLRGVKMQIEAENILDGGEVRRRTLYEDARDLTPVRFTEARRQDFGRVLALRFSGAF